MIKETFLDSLLRELRIKRVKDIIIKKENCVLLDIGCGWEARFLKQIEPYIKTGIGIDFKAPSISTSKIKTIEYNMKNKLPFDDDSFDIVTLLAVLEHLENPTDIIKEVRRVLKHDGLLLITVPSKYAKPVLEFLSYKLKIIDRNEIEDHKQYYNKIDLYQFFAQIENINSSHSNGNLKIIKHKYFQFGMNNFLIIKKV